ncbi:MULTISPECIES: XdhC family protein [unclassified Streptomyces]|uniref:XdhC family protein n=1 Tax=unclassified Streptomyces TaxID=2593676 RepID=UPI0022594579|nr:MULTISPECIES: XdhC/CoxI family protein [unclassified Streptomyces]MCX4528076.1 XdhC family protein [Streptomyces sp. NBC_01551]MCX4541309.1 XdhC family protein [Streptomyces sp. NBC_01565]
MRELAQTARQWAVEGRGGFLARPVTEQGFGPRDPAGAVLIDPRGECVGALYRGVFDAELVAEAGAMRDGETARVCEVSVGAGEAVEARLTCGGQAEILLQPLESVPAAWWELLAEGVGVALVTRLNERADHAVSEVVRATDEPGSDSERRAGELLATRRPGRDALYGGSGLVLVEAYPSAPYVVIGGGGELGEVIARQAGLLGWEAVVVTETAQAEKVLAARRDAACLAMLSHDPEFDVPTLRTALALGIPYVGALGSRRTTARRREGLLAAGVSEARLETVHGPIGLDLGAQTPAETALAICAEMLAVLGGRDARGVRDADGPLRG